MLEKYVAIFRSQGLFHAYIDKDNIRRYNMYHYVNKRLLYLYGKQLLSYSRPKVSLNYRFFKKFPESIDVNAYNKKKSDAFKDIEKQLDSKRLEKIPRYVGAYAHILKTQYKVTYAEQSNQLKQLGLNIDKSVIGRYATTYQNTDK